jgi:hypothetical protein
MFLGNWSASILYMFLGNWYWKINTIYIAITSAQEVCHASPVTLRP